MKLHRDITINGKPYAAGMQVAGKCSYPFFLLHMGLFGLSGFLMAYAADDAPLHFLFLHGGIAIGVYLMFYLAIFGRDEVRWMLVNAALGLFGIYVEIGWLLSLFGKSPGDFGWMRHVVPFSYYILYTFLLRQLVLDLFDAREDPARRKRVEAAYVIGSLLLYLVMWVAGR